MRRANPTRAGLATGLGVVFLVGWGIQIATFAQQPQQQPQRVQQQLQQQQQQQSGQAGPRRPQQQQPRRSRAPVGRSVYGRDPFKFPFIGEGGPGGRGGGGQPRGPTIRVPGKRGLLIARLKLEGVVLHQGGLIAVVDDFRNRAFFLRETDVLYNGVVEKITWDSIVFKENVLDSQGRVTTREVVRRLSSAPACAP